MSCTGGIRLKSIVVLTITLVLAFPAIAEGCEPTSSPAFLDIGPSATGHRYYSTGLEWAVCSFGIPECGSPAVYEESNGIDGWQRADEVVDDTCGGAVPGDTIIFF